MIIDEKGLLEMKETENKIYSIATTSLLWMYLLENINPFQEITNGKVSAFITIMIIVSFLATYIIMFDIFSFLRCDRNSKKNKTKKEVSEK